MDLLFRYLHLDPNGLFMVRDGCSAFRGVRSLVLVAEGRKARRVRSYEADINSSDVTGRAHIS